MPDVAMIQYEYNIYVEAPYNQSFNGSHKLPWTSLNLPTIHFAQMECSTMRYKLNSSSCLIILDKSPESFSVAGKDEKKHETP